MAIDKSSMGGNSAGVGLMAFAEEHGGVLLALGVVVVLLIAYHFIKGNAGSSGTSSTTASTQDLSGLQTNAQGQPVVYVPTSTEFYTDNSVVATAAQGAPVSVNSPVSTTTITAPTTVSTSTTNTVGIQPPGVPISTKPGSGPVRQPPVTPPPGQHHGALMWDQTYVIQGGQTLSGIAAAITSKVRQQGAPNSVIVSYQEIYSHNQSVIDNAAREHGNPIKGGPQNNVFPGEHLTVPRWNKNTN